MKKNISALFLLLFLVVLLFSGCGREQNRPSSSGLQAESLSFYRTEILSLADNVQAVHDLRYSDGNLYLACGDSSDRLIVYVLSDGGDWKELSTDYSAQTLSAFTVDHEGGVWFTVYTDNNYQVSFLPVHLDQDGNALLEKSINQYTEFSNPSDLATDMDGNIYMATTSAVIVMDSQGEFLFQLDEGADTDALACTRDGSVIFNGYGRMIKQLNFGAQDFSDVYSVSGAGDITLGSGKDDVVIYYTNAGIYRLDMNSGTSSASENKEAAWSFISNLLSEKEQDNLVSGYPLRESSLMKKLESYMQQDNIVTVLESDDGDMKFIDLKPLDQEAIDRLVDLVKSTDRLLPTDDILLDILKEEAEAYFSGDKSVDQVAETIQNRISTYVNEQQ